MEWLRLSLIRLFFSRKFLKYRYIYTYALSAPFMYGIIVELERGNPVFMEKMKKISDKNLAELRAIELNVTEKEWMILENAKVKETPK